MHENVLISKERFLDSVRKELESNKKEQVLKRGFYRSYRIEEFHNHEMNEDELKEFRREYDELINSFLPKQ